MHEQGANVSHKNLCWPNWQGN